ncbi:MAG: alpha/beta hydrolase [Calditrichaeota bacterium]|nr:MAG: alpha/beta hydrolase [Calditrichota bacterium]MBL1203922.1 alpha/beta hydrolase [Calditrichota bacterium]NOG43755.1 alpha/beta hydrolase [Calditrichota bacterium]
MSKIIIAIHGLGNKPPKEQLEKWWLAAIQEGLQKSGIADPDLSFKLVYWADILYPEPLEADVTDEDNPLYLDEPYLPASGNLKAEPENLKTRLLKYAEKQLDKIFLKEDMTLNFEGVTDSIIHSYFRELDIYYRGDETENEQEKSFQSRNTIRERLKSVLLEHKKDEVILLCHSMGTIVAYEVLQDNPDELSINTLVTFGSPLGLPVVVSRIYADQKLNSGSEEPLKTPVNVHSKWFNLADPQDMVALDPTLADDYQANALGVQAQDLSVINDYEANDERNPHKSFGYLRTVEMANIIRTFLAEEEKHGLPKYYSQIKHKLVNLFSRRKK